MDNPTGEPKALFDAIALVTHAVVDMRKLADSYDDTDYSGGRNIPTPEQVAAGAAILAKAKAARRKLRELGCN